MSKNTGQIMYDRHFQFGQFGFNPDHVQKLAQLRSKSTIKMFLPTELHAIGVHYNYFSQLYL